ncbi:MAG: hypothetical protein ACJA1O_002298, partial [Spirosomataceae bacterium]
NTENIDSVSQSLNNLKHKKTFSTSIKPYSTKKLVVLSAKSSELIKKA